MTDPGALGAWVRGELGSWERIGDVTSVDFETETAEPDPRPVTLGGTRTVSMTFGFDQLNAGAVGLMMGLPVVESRYLPDDVVILAPATMSLTGTGSGARAIIVGRAFPDWETRLRRAARREALYYCRAVTALHGGRHRARSGPRLPRAEVPGNTLTGRPDTVWKDGHWVWESLDDVLAERWTR